jgi:signal transduction histidine kinase
VELNELFLRRISAELHDGPAQDLGLLLLQSDSSDSRRVAADHGLGSGESSRGRTQAAPTQVRSSLQRALQDIRAIANGLRLPELRELSLADTIRRVASIHERRTGSEVSLVLGDLPDDSPLPLKITAYRLAQEALSNAFRHAGGQGQSVRVYAADSLLCLEISDSGPGFDPVAMSGLEGHLGLQSMRERVEILGGQFAVQSTLGEGTLVRAVIPLHAEERES